MAYMTHEEREALIGEYLGKTVHVGIDRPIGYVHHKEKYDLVYPINYGYVPGVLGGDGEELDVFVLGIDEPVEEADVRIIGVVRRRNDVEDKLIGAPEGMRFSVEEARAAVHFQEQYYDSEIEILP
ncbi:MAG: inorganic diphosphatase [Clostridia bacterium]|nr:inorganic diphosphatase [Clostridia bacterium]